MALVHNIEVKVKVDADEVTYTFPGSDEQGDVGSSLDRIAFLEDFGGKADGGITDNGEAFRKAFAAGVTTLYLGSSGVYGIATGDIELPERFNIYGKGDDCELKYLGNSSSFTMFTLRGTQGASNWKNGGTFSDVVISSENLATTWFLGEYVQNINFERVFIYNSRTLMNDFHYVNFNTCRLIASLFSGRANLPGSVVSESPKFLNCFSSNSPIDIRDTADLMIIGCTMFAGDYIVRTGTERGDAVLPDLRRGFPVVFTNSVFDASNGQAWNLANVAYASISGCFVSCGRSNLADGAYLDKVYDSSIVGCTFTYCGRYGMTIERSNKVSITGCNFNGNQTGGLALFNSSNINVVGGSAGTSYISGGYYVQPVGITSPADDCTNVVVTGFNFGSELPSKYSFSSSIQNGNKVIACPGVLDTVFAGSSGERPSGGAYGQPFYDRQIGKPIWWNTTANAWQDASGNNV